MAWFRKEKQPRQPQRQRLEIPPDVWEKCEQCGHTDLAEKFARNVEVCPGCGHHRRLRASEYLAMLLDEGTIEEHDTDLRSADPLGFPDYPSRIRKASANAGESDAILTATGQLGGLPVNLGVMDFAFMGGSMGSVVGEKIARLGQRSLERKYPLILISASGGARMQEGVLSLMQMAKASAVLAQLGDRRIPYISILTNPTTGGVSASYAMLGDAILAEPGAVIGFDHSEAMLAQARARVAQAGWREVTLVGCAAQELAAQPALAARVDALLFHYTHDILRSPRALAAVLACARPGARVAVAGIKYFSGWLAPLNFWVYLKNLGYNGAPGELRSPWDRLAPRLHDWHFEPTQWGMGYLACGLLRAEAGVPAEAVR